MLMKLHCSCPALPAGTTTARHSALPTTIQLPLPPLSHILLHHYAPAASLASSHALHSLFLPQPLNLATLSPFPSTHQASYQQRTPIPLPHQIPLHALGLTTGPASCRPLSREPILAVPPASTHPILASTASSLDITPGPSTPTATSPRSIPLATASSPPPAVASSHAADSVVDSPPVPATLCPPPQHHPIILSAALDNNGGQLLELEFRGPKGGATNSRGDGAAQSTAWRSVSVRPVVLRGERCLQFAYFTTKQSFTKNWSMAEADEQLQELLGRRWSSIVVQTLTQHVAIQLTKKGKAIIQQQSKSTPAQGPIQLGHNRLKSLPLDPSQPSAFLQQLGIQTPQGQVKASMQAKLTQINEFLKLLVHTGIVKEWDPAAAQKLHILDCGCGSSHLTLSTYHYLTQVRDIPCRLSGVDTNQHLMDKANQLCRALSIPPDNAKFHASTILDYSPPYLPDVVLALHACDTASDEALALGVRHGARVIMAVPCCHKQSRLPPRRPPLTGMLRHPIMRQRMSDMVIDCMRAAWLRTQGYRTDIVEFISVEHTSRNLLLRAVKAAPSMPEQERQQAQAEYNGLKEFWGFTPYVQGLLQ